MRSRHRLIREPGHGRVTIEVQDSGDPEQVHHLEVDAAAYERWVGGLQHVQDAFPELDRGQREILITGLGPASWARLIGPDPEE